jgi:hypothetical protein
MTTATQRGRWPGVARVALAPLVWLERARGWRRRALLLVYAVVGVGLGACAWRSVTLSGLPDVGDPPDLGALRSLDVPDDRNAFVLYRQAAEKVEARAITGDFGRLWNIIRGGWAKAGPDAHAWVEANREALALWRRGTERPDALAVPLSRRVPFEERKAVETLPTLAEVALLEGARLEEAGDLAGAWGWYNAVLRASRHLGMHGGWRDRMTSAWMLDLAKERVIPWGESAKGDAQLLRRALRDVAALEAMTPPASMALKVDHLTMLNGLEDPDRLMRGYERLTTGGGTYEAMPRAYQALWFLRNEPERSRRVARLLLANRLAYCDRPADRRPKRVDRYVLGNTSFDLDAFVAGPDAPPGAHRLSAADLARWFDSTTFLWRFSGSYRFLAESCDGDRTGRETLLMILAERCYEREHGAPPPSPEALVGPYLERLPSRYADPDAKRAAGTP